MNENESTPKIELGAAYLGVSKNATVERAAALYVKRFGVAPAGVFCAGAIWLVGPIPDDDNPQLQRCAPLQTEPQQTALFEVDL